MMRFSFSTKSAFSLVELSIVLVILGLLVGGVLSGQSLIRAAELRALSTEYSRYVAAIGSFRDKYFAIPGDMNNATQFWGTAATCPGTSASPSTTAATCNGDGNGTLSPAATTSNEIFRFWQQLANAGLIEGSYSGVTNSTTASDQVALVGTNVPKSKMSNAGWSVYGVGTQSYTAQTLWFDGSYGNVFIFGAPQPGNITQNAILKPEEIWNIDTKMDDGKPGTGSVLVFATLGPTGCHDSTVSTSTNIAPTAKYLLSNSAVICNMIVKTGY